MITIHAGLHKTGTTAIQRYFAHWKPDCGSAFIYLDPKTLLGSRGFQIPADSTRRKAVDDAIGSGKHVIVSHEGYLGRGFDMYPNARDRAADIRDYFSGRSDFQVVLYLRPQHHWVESAYQQTVKRGGNTESGDEFSARILASRYSRYSALVTDLIKELGPANLVVRAYIPNMDSVADFLGVLGAHGPEFPIERFRENTSVSPLQTEILRRVNKIQPDLRLECRFLFERVLAPQDFLGYSALSPATQRDLMRIMQSDWKELTEIVKSTNQAQPLVFQELLVSAANEEIKPFVGDTTVSGDLILQEAVRSLVGTLPFVAQYRKTQGVVYSETPITTNSRGDTRAGDLEIGRFGDLGRFLRFVGCRLKARRPR